MSYSKGDRIKIEFPVNYSFYGFYCINDGSKGTILMASRDGSDYDNGSITHQCYTLKIKMDEYHENLGDCDGLCLKGFGVVIWNQKEDILQQFIKIINDERSEISMEEARMVFLQQLMKDKDYLVSELYNLKKEKLSKEKNYMELTSNKKAIITKENTGYKANFEIWKKQKLIDKELLQLELGKKLKSIDDELEDKGMTHIKEHFNSVGKLETELLAIEKEYENWKEENVLALEKINKKIADLDTAINKFNGAKE